MISADAADGQKRHFASSGIGGAFRNVRFAALFRIALNISAP
jgi:hypothetical protein